MILLSVTYALEEPCITLWQAGPQITNAIFISSDIPQESAVHFHYAIFRNANNTCSLIRTSVKIKTFYWWHTDKGGLHVVKHPESSSNFETFSLLWSPLERHEDIWDFTTFLAAVHATLILAIIQHLPHLQIIITWTFYYSLTFETCRKSTVCNVTAKIMLYLLCAPPPGCWAQPSADQGACWTGWPRRPNWVCCFRLWHREEKQIACSPTWLLPAASAQLFDPDPTPSHKHTSKHLKWVRNFYKNLKTSLSCQRVILRLTSGDLNDLL